MHETSRPQRSIRSGTGSDWDLATSVPQYPPSKRRDGARPPPLLDMVSRHVGALTQRSTVPRRGRRPPATIRAIIAPHAGIMFSGPVAAPMPTKRPHAGTTTSRSWSGHRISSGFDGVALYPDGAFDSPSRPRADRRATAPGLLWRCRSFARCRRAAPRANIPSRCSCRFSAAAAGRARSCRC